MTELIKTLSKRECEVYNAMVANERPKDTAVRLDLSVQTVTEYRRRVKVKLGVEKSKDVVDIAMKLNSDRMFMLETALKLFLEPDFRGSQDQVGEYMGWKSWPTPTERIEYARKALNGE